MRKPNKLEFKKCWVVKERICALAADLSSICQQVRIWYTWGMWNSGSWMEADVQVRWSSICRPNLSEQTNI